MFEGVLGFKLECHGNGTCLAACVEDGDTPEIGLPFSIPTNQTSHTAQPFFRTRCLGLVAEGDCKLCKMFKALLMSASYVFDIDVTD